MLHERIPNLAKFVEPDRVRREVYTDAAIFEMEMERIHERVWIYCGHETQVPKGGDYYTTQIGRQPMLMVRGKDGKVNVLYNRCPHRGSMMCGDRSGNAGEFFRCSYHSWTFHHDGKLRAIPMMESGYAGTRRTRVARRRARDRETHRQDPALLPHALGLLDRHHREVGQLPDAQLPVRPLHPDRLHGPAAQGP